METILQGRREAASARLAALQNQLGLKVLEGGASTAPVHAEIAQAERELAEIASAEGAAVRLERQASAQAETARRAELRELLAQHEAAKIDALARVEAAVWTVVDGFKFILHTIGEQRRIIQELGGRIPDAFQSVEAERRLSCRLSSALATIVNFGGRVGNRFGAMQLWPGAVSETRDWADLEKAEGLRVLGPIIVPNEESEQ